MCGNHILQLVSYHMQYGTLSTTFAMRNDRIYWKVLWSYFVAISEHFVWSGNRMWSVAVTKWTDLQSTAIWLGILMGILGLTDCTQDLSRKELRIVISSSRFSQQGRTIQPRRRHTGPSSQGLTSGWEQPESDNEWDLNCPSAKWMDSFHIAARDC